MVGAIAFNNCSNDFELTENWENITIVYGLLDDSDTAQYIRIEKAFLDPNTNALVLAQEADSIFYDDLEVELQEIPQNGGSGDFFSLERVDANLEGYPKDDGTFASSPNYVYKFGGNLRMDSRYRLKITRPDGEEVVAETGIAGNFDIISPNENSSLQILPERSLSFVWQHDQANSAFYDLILRLHYTEAPASNPADSIATFIDWTIVSNVVPGNETSLTHRLEDGVDFFRFLQNNLEVANVVRNVKYADFIVRAGGNDLYEYINAGQASSGVTSAEVFPSYSNVNNGIGLFSTRFTNVVPFIEVRASTLEELREGIYTSDLGFQ